MVKTESPRLTYAFIGVFSIVFLLEVYAELVYGQAFSDAILSNFGLSLQNILQGRLWVLITSVFLHASPEHLLLNMIALYVFGRTVELHLGKRKFLLSFFASALIADMFVVSSSLIGITPIDIPTIGASAAIFGLMGVAMVTKPLEMIFYPYLIPIPLVIVALLYTVYNIASFVAVLLGGASSDISYVAHVGGLFSGLLLGFKEERSRKGFVIILFLLVLFLTTPFILSIAGFLESFNYISILSKFFGG
jgi:rhomboid protease GluP